MLNCLCEAVKILRKHGGDGFVVVTRGADRSGDFCDGRRGESAGGYCDGQGEKAAADVGQ